MHFVLVIFISIPFPSIVTSHFQRAFALFSITLHCCVEHICLCVVLIIALHSIALDFIVLICMYCCNSRFCIGWASSAGSVCIRIACIATQCCIIGEQICNTVVLRCNLLHCWWALHCIAQNCVALQCIGGEGVELAGSKDRVSAHLVDPLLTDLQRESALLASFHHHHRNRHHHQLCHSKMSNISMSPCYHLTKLLTDLIWNQFYLSIYLKSDS